MSLLNIKNLTIKLAHAEPRTLVHDVNFSIEAGETLALVGESGSGKSLTALSIMRLLGKQFDTSGTIFFAGEELMQTSEKRMQAIRGKDISMVFQEPQTALNPLHTIGRQISEMLTHDVKMRRCEDVKKDIPATPHISSSSHLHIQSLLDQVGLSHFKNRLDAYPHQLSGGERQRVMIAMAIANHPKLLIADEPTTAVDVHVQQHILELLARLKRELKMSMLFITHDLPLVKRMADKVAVMKAGEIVELGAVKEVFTTPKHAYTQKLLDSAPKGTPLPIRNDAKPILEAEQLGVKFPIRRGVFARTVGYHTGIADINFELRAGETLGVVGESGSGKTTLAFALLRMQKHTGRVVFLGRDMQTLDPRELRGIRKDIQMVFQDPFSSLNPRMTIGEIIGEGINIHDVKMRRDEDVKMDASPNNPHITTSSHPHITTSSHPHITTSSHPHITTSSHHHIQDILTKVGLSPDMASRYPHEFSGGQRQRISIARAMVLNPKLVILDEPTSALDLTVQSQILDLLKKFQAEQGISYIFISHDLRVIRAISHRIMVLKSGNIIEHGSREDILSHPKAEYTQKLIEAAMLET